MTTTPGLKQLTNWISQSAEPEKADGYATRLYEEISREAVNEAHLRLRAEATNAALVDEMRKEVYAHQALLRVIQTFTGGRSDVTATRVYQAIARFNLGDMLRPDGTVDAYRVPVELADENT
ncbi:hypothetical protein [Streptomyces sp. NPDC057429]|uniref:hypothetical protein n=1 Tax=Streptomyces sp. NPDC057429 TaxID=3346130 RepID=UPI0036B60EBD